MNITQAMAIMHPMLSVSPELETVYEHIKSECHRLGLHFEQLGQEGSRQYFSYEFKIDNHKGILSFNDEGLGVTSIVFDTTFAVFFEPSLYQISMALELIVPIESIQDVSDHMQELLRDDDGF